jgi:hypothetical protein
MQKSTTIFLFVQGACLLTRTDWGCAVSDAGETLHLHNADAAGRGLEPDPVQPVGLHPESIRYACIASPLPRMCGHVHV